MCPVKDCRSLNHKSKSACELCGKSKPKNQNAEMPLSMSGPPGLFKPGDWACSSCGNVNWDWRDRCNLCGNLKPDLQDKREGGKGGGYFDRQDPADRKAHESDDEDFDEFGRKKTGRRKAAAAAAKAGAKSEKAKAALARLYGKSGGGEKSGGARGSREENRSRSRERRR
eukprot:g3558.t1